LNLKELDSIVDALGNFLAGAVVVLGLFALQLAFSTGEFAEVRRLSTGVGIAAVVP
jgi:hypothetical protein